MKRNIMILAAVVMLAALAIYQNNEKKEVAASHSEDAQPKRGFAAPAFELPALDDKNYAVGGQTEKLLLVNFWASWCGPCELEAPDLQELHESHGDVIALYGVNATSYDKERQARQFVDDFQLTFPILMDRDGVATSLYKVSQFPTTLLIDHNGVIRERITGVISKQEWERLIDKWAEI